MSHLTFLEAGVVGLIQGVTELFPVSSLGHNVLIPALIGGSWATDLNVAKPESPYLAFIVGMHVATAIALLIYFWRDWVRIIGGFFTSLGHWQGWHPRVATRDERLAWMIILATIPVGLVGLVAEHAFRVLFGKPILAGVFLIVNGVILYCGEKFRPRASVEADREVAAQRAGTLTAAGPGGAVPARGVPGTGQPRPGPPGPGQPGPAQPGFGPPGPAQMASGQPEPAPPGLEQPGPAQMASGQPEPAPPGLEQPGPAQMGPGQQVRREEAVRHGAGHQAVREEEMSLAVASDERLARMGFTEAVIIGASQVLALLAGISRDGVTMVTGMARGLSREDAARFAFLLATPVILAAGVLKVPDLLGPLGNGIRGQILFGSVLSGLGAYVSVRFLVRYFQTRTLYPFALYCFVFGLLSVIYLGVIK
jgi:undecaprenyl-diphosphatase